MSRADDENSEHPDIAAFITANYPLTRAQWLWVREERKRRDPRPPKLRWWSRLRDIRLWLTCSR